MTDKHSRMNKRKAKVKRRSSRIKWIRPIIIETEIGNTILGHTSVLSFGGAGLRTAGHVSKGEEISLHILIDSKWRNVKAKVVYLKKFKEPGLKSIYDVGVEFAGGSIGSHLWLLSKRKKSLSSEPELRKN
jgi:PilZ domain